MKRQSGAETLNYSFKNHSHQLRTTKLAKLTERLRFFFFFFVHHCDIQMIGKVSLIEAGLGHLIEPIFF